MFRKMSVIALAAAMMMPISAQAGLLDFGMTEERVKEIIKQYLEENPEIIAEAQQAAQMKAIEMRQENNRKALAEHRDELERDPTTPVLGNPDGDVTVVEFFDYNCGFCKKMFQDLWPRIKADGKIRWVLKDLPVLSPTSRAAALAGLAANKQGKYLEMHQALMEYQGNLSDDAITGLAKDIDLDMKKFESDWKSAELAKVLDSNRNLANVFEIRGIPQFFIGDYISQGAIMGTELEDNAKLIRSKK